MIHFTRFRFAFRLFQFHFLSSGLLSLFFLKSLFRTNATTPPLDVAPAAVNATLATHAGHIVTPLLSFAAVCWFFPNTQPGDRAILPRTCGMPRPIARPVSAAWPLTAFHERAHSAGGAAIPPSPARANVWKPPATTSHAVARGA